MVVMSRRAHLEIGCMITYVAIKPSSRIAMGVAVVGKRGVDIIVCLRGFVIVAALLIRFCANGSTVAFVMWVVMRVARRRSCRAAMVRMGVGMIVFLNSRNVAATATCGTYCCNRFHVDRACFNALMKFRVVVVVAIFVATRIWNGDWLRFI